VLPGLWVAGHRAFAVTLSGVGERAHQPSGAIAQQTHIADVLGVEALLRILPDGA
jgi:hypothetical protein